MGKTPKAIHQGLCDVTLGINGFDDAVIDSMQASFELSPNFESVFIIHDSSKAQEFLHDSNINNHYGLTRYKSWVFDGTEEEQTVGHKYIQMYPYETMVLQEGDYIAYDYYHNGKKTVWFCLALDSSSKYEQIGKIRPCTNEVRFVNEDGALIRVPCVFDNKINSEKNITLSNLKYINGITTIYMQLNPDSQQIKPNQRLLFGRKGAWTAFRVVSVGVNNFMNPIYWDNDSAKVLEVTMEAAYVNEDTDDIENGIADGASYSIKLSLDHADMLVGDSFRASATLVKDGVVISDKAIYWKTSNYYVATASDLGTITAKHAGNCVVTAYMAENETVFARLYISVVEEKENNYEVVIDPYEGSSYGILQGNEQIFTCYLHNNGTELEDMFTFTVETEANDSCYEFSVINGNSFSVKNTRMSVYPLTIHCESENGSFDASIILKGAW